MKLLITAATEMEMPLIEDQKIEITTCITGIGAAVSMYHLQEALLKNNYDLVIQCGIAGSFNLKNYNLKELVIVKSDVFADVGVSEKGNFKTLFEMDFLKENQFPFKNGYLENDTKNLEKFNLPLVKAVTVNTVTDDMVKIKQLQHKFAASIESMEGAALHYICLQKKIPFLQIRGISNEVGERDKSKWEIKETLFEINRFLNRIVNEIL